MCLNRRCVLLSGGSVAADDDLCEALQHTAQVITNLENDEIESTILQQPVDLVIMEVSKSRLGEIEIIERLSQRFPEIKVIVVGDRADQQSIAAAFAQGAKDAFRRPYKTNLIVERVKVLLDCSRFD